MLPNDSGPIYKETLMGRFPVEPWNSVSNIIFLFTLIYWGIKVYQAYKQHLFLAFALPVLCIGFVGGTIYHATRSHEVWLLMDWMPIMILTLAASIYYFVKQKMRWYYVTAIILIPFITMFLIYRVFTVPEIIRGMLGYPFIAFMVLFPIMRYAKLNQWKNIHWLFIGIALFLLAITCRTIDKNVDFALLPMGTHWLWHTFGGLAVFFVMGYIFKDDLTELDGERNR